MAASAWVRLTVPKDANAHQAVLGWFAQQVTGGSAARPSVGVGHASAHKHSGAPRSGGANGSKEYAIDKVRPKVSKTLASIRPPANGASASKTKKEATDPKALVPVPLYAVYAAEIFTPDLNQHANRIYLSHPHANYLLMFSRNVADAPEGMVNLTVHGALCSAHLYRDGLPSMALNGFVSVSSLLRSVMIGHGSSKPIVEAEQGMLRLDSSPSPPRPPADSTTPTKRCEDHETVCLSTRLFTANTPTPHPERQGYADVTWLDEYNEALRDYASQCLVNASTGKPKPRRPGAPYYLVDQLESGCAGSGPMISFRVDELPYYKGYMRRLFEMALFIQEVAQRGAGALAQDEELRMEQQRLETYALEANLLNPVERERDYKARLLVTFQCLRGCMKARSRRLAEQAEQLALGVNASNTAATAASLAESDCIIDAPAQLLLRAIAWMLEIRHQYIFRTESQALELAFLSGSELDAVTKVSDVDRDRLVQLQQNCPSLESFPKSIKLRTDKREPINDVAVWIETELPKTRTPNSALTPRFCAADRVASEDELEARLAQALANNVNAIARYNSQDSSYLVIYEPIGETRARIERCSAPPSNGRSRRSHRGGNNNTIDEEEQTTARQKRDQQETSVEYLRRVSNPCNETEHANRPELLQQLVGQCELPTVYYTTVDERTVSMAPGFMDLMAACVDRMVHYPEEFEGRNKEGKIPARCMGSLSRVRRVISEEAAEGRSPQPSYAVVFYSHLYGELSARDFTQIRGIEGVSYVFLPTLIMANAKGVSALAAMVGFSMKALATAVLNGRSGAWKKWIPDTLTTESAGAILAALGTTSPGGELSLAFNPYATGYAFHMPPDVGFEIHPTISELIDITPRLEDRCLSRAQLVHDVYAMPLDRDARAKWDEYELGRFMLGNHTSGHALPTRIVTVPLGEMDHNPFAALPGTRACVFCLPAGLASPASSGVDAAASGLKGRQFMTASSSASSAAAAPQSASSSKGAASGTGAPSSSDTNNNNGAIAAAQLLGAYRCSACEHTRLQHIPCTPQRELFIALNYREFSAWQFALSLQPARRLLASLDEGASGGLNSVASADALDDVLQPLGAIWTSLTQELDGLTEKHRYFGDLAADMRVRYDIMHSDAQRLRLITGDEHIRYTDDEILRIRQWIGHDPEAFYSKYKGPASTTFSKTGRRAEIRWGSRGSFAVSTEEYHTGKKDEQGREIVHPAGSWIDYGNNEEKGDVFDFVIRELFNRNRKEGFIPAVRTCHLWVLKTYGMDALSRKPGQSKAAQARAQKNGGDLNGVGGHSKRTGGTSSSSSSGLGARNEDPDESRRKEARAKWGAAMKLTPEERSRAALGVRYLRDVRHIEDPRVLYSDCFRFMPVFNLQDKGIGGSRADYPALVIAVSNPTDPAHVVNAMQAIVLDAATNNKVPNLTAPKRTSNSAGQGNSGMIQGPRTEEQRLRAAAEFGACVAIGEGGETMASVAQACEELEVWCSLGISFLSNFPYIGAARTGDPNNWGYGLLLCADNDLDANGQPDSAKAESVMRAARALADRGYTVRICKPNHIQRPGGEKGTDFNDITCLVRPIERANAVIRDTLKSGQVINPKPKEVPKPEKKAGEEEEEEKDDYDELFDITPKEVLRARALEAIKKKRSAEEPTEPTLPPSTAATEPSATTEPTVSVAKPKEGVPPRQKPNPTKQTRFEDSAKTRKHITKTGGKSKDSTPPQKKKKAEPAKKESSSESEEPEEKKKKAVVEEKSESSGSGSSDESDAKPKSKKVKKAPERPLPPSSESSSSSSESEAEPQKKDKEPAAAPRVRLTKKRFLVEGKDSASTPALPSEAKLDEDISIPEADVDAALLRPADAVKRNKVLDD